MMLVNPFTRQIIVNDCGTGAGGFKPGNKCSKGGAGGGKYKTYLELADASQVQTGWKLLHPKKEMNNADPSSTEYRVKGLSASKGRIKFELEGAESVELSESTQVYVRKPS